VVDREWGSSVSLGGEWCSHVILLRGEVARVATWMAYNFSSDHVTLHICDTHLASLGAYGDMCRSTLRGHSRNVTSVAFSADGKLLVSASDDSTIQLRSTASAAKVWTFRGDSSCLSPQLRRMMDDVVSISSRRVCVQRGGVDTPERSFFPLHTLECFAVAPVSHGGFRAWIACGDENGNVYLLGD